MRRNSALFEYKLFNKRHRFEKIEKRFLNNSPQSEQVKLNVDITIASHSKCIAFLAIHPRAIIPHSSVINEVLKCSFHRDLKRDCGKFSYECNALLECRAYWFRYWSFVMLLPNIFSLLFVRPFGYDGSPAKKLLFHNETFLYRCRNEQKELKSKRFINLISHSDFLWSLLTWPHLQSFFVIIITFTVRNVIKRAKWTSRQQLQSLWMCWQRTHKSQQSLLGAWNQR